MERREKIQLLIIAGFIILIVIAVWGVFQRQLLEKRAAKTGRPVSVQFIAPDGKKAGDTFETSIQMVSNQQVQISGAEATVNVSNKFTIDDVQSKCIAPFDRVSYVTIDNSTNTATFLCAIDPNITPPTLQVGAPVQFARIVLTIKDKESGEAPITFLRTRVTQANLPNQAPDIANDGQNTVYRISSASPTDTITQLPPDCTGGISVDGVPLVNGRYTITKGQTVLLRAHGLVDPNENPAQSITSASFRYKPTQLNTGQQCPTTDDGSLLGQGTKTFTGTNLELTYSYTLNTSNIQPGEYYFWANPVDNQGLTCSGNPYGNSNNNYCGVGVGCTNCYTIIQIVSSTTPTTVVTLTPTPTTPAGGISITPTIPSSCTRKGEGDADCNGSINGIDYSIWLNHQCIPDVGQTCSDLRPDFDTDGDVDYHDNDNGTNTGDREIWARYFGT